MKKIAVLIINFIILCIFLQLPSFARYYELLNNIVGRATIAEPIIKVENLQDTIKTEVNKETTNKEYYFIVKNYEIDSFNNKRISEVDFYYDIEIKNYDDNFPVEYKLYDCDTGEELLNGNNISDKFEIEKNVEYERKCKLIINWNSKEEMSSIDDIDIIINVSQIDNEV